jgi:hypothetical protein
VLPIPLLHWRLAAKARGVVTLGLKQLFEVRLHDVKVEKKKKKKKS